MHDTTWTREVVGRLAAQYPRVDRTDVEDVVALWTRLLRPSLPASDLPRVVEQQVREALHAVAVPVPAQRAAADLRLRL